MRRSRRRGDVRPLCRDRCGLSADEKPSNDRPAPGKTGREHLGGQHLRQLFAAQPGPSPWPPSSLPASPAPMPAPIKIGVIAETQAVAGSSIPQAAQIAADEINAKGGVDGRKIEIVAYDNHSSSAESVRAFQRVGQRRPRRRGDRELYQRGRAGAGALGGAAEDRDDHAGRGVRRHHRQHRQGLRGQQIHVPRLSDVERAGGPRLRHRPRTCWSTGSR